MANKFVSYDPDSRHFEDGVAAPIVANQAASTAADVAGLKTDLNALLTKLKAAGIMAPNA